MTSACRTPKRRTCISSDLRRLHRACGIDRLLQFGGSLRRQEDCLRNTRSCLLLKSWSVKVMSRHCGSSFSIRYLLLHRILVGLLVTNEYPEHEVPCDCYRPPSSHLRSSKRGVPGCVVHYVAFASPVEPDEGPFGHELKSLAKTCHWCKGRLCFRW